eukprot:5804280-Amphidinium_carterae.1
MALGPRRVTVTICLVFFRVTGCDNHSPSTQQLHWLEYKLSYDSKTLRTLDNGRRTFNSR